MSREVFIFSLHVGCGTRQVDGDLVFPPTGSQSAGPSSLLQSQDAHLTGFPKR